MNEYTTNKPEILETETTDRAERYRADTIRIKQLVSGLLTSDDSEQCEMIAELVCKVFSATYNDKIYGEGIYYHAMREIFVHHEVGRNSFDAWLEKNSWLAT